MKFLQLKYSGSLPAFVDCQKDSGSAVEKRTQVKPVLLAVKIFAVCAIVDTEGLLGSRPWHQDERLGLDFGAIDSCDSGLLTPPQVQILPERDRLFR